MMLLRWAKWYKTMSPWFGTAQPMDKRRSKERERAYFDQLPATYYGGFRDRAEGKHGAETPAWFWLSTSSKIFLPSCHVALPLLQNKLPYFDVPRYL